MVKISVVLLYFIGHQVKLMTIFENIMNIFELNLDEINRKNPFLTVALGDFNAKSQTWFKNDIASFEGPKRDVLTCSR